MPYNIDKKHFDSSSSYCMSTVGGKWQVSLHFEV